MAVVVQRGDGWSRLDMHGEIDLKAIEEYRPHADDLVVGEPARVILGLEHVTFMDSTGLGFIVQIHNSIKGWGGTVCLYRPTPAVVDLLNLIGLSQHLKLVDSQQDLNTLIGI